MPTCPRRSNVTARVERIAEPRGICVSGRLRQLDPPLDVVDRPGRQSWYPMARRARQFRDVATSLADMDGPEPNWPKLFLVTHHRI